MQEGGAFQADLDERRLHAGQHACHASDVDIAYQPAAGVALHHQFLHLARGKDRDARLLRSDINEDLLVH